MIWNTVGMAPRRQDLECWIEGFYVLKRQTISTVCWFQISDSDFFIVMYYFYYYYQSIYKYDIILTTRTHRNKNYKPANLKERQENNWNTVVHIFACFVFSY